MDIILASASPRRRELMARITPDFTVCAADVDERAITAETPALLARRLAEAKCRAVARERARCAVIGCDTVVVFGKEVLGKPKDKTDAVKTLKMLSGKTHYVITGVCVRNRFKKVVDFDRTEVKFNILTDEFIQNYVNSGSPMDKAGSYGIQDGGIVKEYFGSYTNVVGLPVTLAQKLIKEVISDI